MDVRITTVTARVLRAFLGNPQNPQYGFDLMQLLGLSSGSLYPILARLERAGWIEGRKEDVDAVREGRPARRYYLLTAEGARDARLALAALSEELRPPSPIMLPGLRSDRGSA
ncbi:PadR family transcriptional regulator [Streptomyces sp. NPDC088788]|uniref:PadR family transcriptional regulator n=1 Tax=Streptomyces sp. NPDC088788 TaxID=3365898 RepID=UPI0038090799